MNANRFSTYTSASAGSDSRGVGGGGGSEAEKKKDLWNAMLDSVASGRKLPERNVVVFGGSVDSQRELLEALSAHSDRRGLGRPQSSGKVPPVANRFALGYTYYDVLDADQEDILARINLYLLSTPSPAFGSLIQPLLTPESIPNTLIVVLLDWSQPWLWLRQLREWILLLRTVLLALSPECKAVMEDAMGQWRERGRGGPVNLDGTTAAVDGDALPPGPGEWEDALGLPLCVVCQNAEKTDILEKTQGWKDDEFDLVLQYLRTVLVKHGASLIYTTPNLPSQLPTLVHACLGVTSLLTREPLKPEVIKRTEVVVPSNWDSWTKILVVREGFDVEKVSTGWSLDLQRPYPPKSSTQQGAGNGHKAGGRMGQADQGKGDDDDGNDDDEDDSDVFHEAQGEVAYEAGPDADQDEDEQSDDDEDENAAVTLYENAIRDPGLDALALAAAGQAGGAGAGSGSNGHRGHHHRLEVETDNVQVFLAEQSRLLEQHRALDEKQREKKEAIEANGGMTATRMRRLEGRMEGGGPLSHAALTSMTGGLDPYAGENPAEVMSSHIGPVQFNMGGIQVDADDMLEQIKNRHEYGSSPEPLSPEVHAKTAPDDVVGSASTGAAGVRASGNIDTDKMSAFFTDLMNRQTPGKS